MFGNSKRAFAALGHSEQKESELNAATRQFFSKHVRTKNLVRGKAPEASLKASYRKVIELSAATTLAAMILLFQAAKSVDLETKVVDKVDIQIEVADIPPTQQVKRPPPPPRPSVPLPTDSEDIPEDMTIASTDLNLTDLPDAPPPPEDDEIPIFIPYDEPPEIIGGMSALMKHLRYPRIAQASGVEGVVHVKVLVSADGVTERTEIIKATPPGMGFEESAMSALKKVKWQPAKQRDREIRVWVAIPVQFKLVSS